ncbi:hypothetical protein KAU33_02500 [Candidatus Dependentiae bacterium]|nr:hypothetical protein [Candidatus Dependentiae bacterium]
MDESLYEYILKEQKKTVNNSNWNNFIRKLKVGDKVVVFNMREKQCTLRKVIAIKPFPKFSDIKLDNNKWYRDGVEIYEVCSQYSCASEYLMELTQELDDLLRDSFIKEYKLVESKNTNQYEFSEERIKGAYLIHDTSEKDAKISEEKMDMIIEAYDNLSDIEKQEFKSIIHLDDKSVMLAELLEEFKKLEKAIVNNV